MVRVTVLYPNESGKRFDHDYYASKHLPMVMERLKGSGMLDGRLPPGFSVPVPTDDPALHDDEDPLEPGDLDLGLAPRVEHTGEE